MIRIVFSMAVLSLCLGCAHQPEAVGRGLPGFPWGVVHGVSAPIAFLGSLVVDVRIYEAPNAGIEYDFGFLIGLGLWWFVLSPTRRDYVWVRKSDE